jgi:hypothetical protein
MGRRFLLVLLALGSVAGFAAGFQSWRWHREFGWGPHGAGHHGRMEAHMDEVAEACVRAAERVRSAPNAAPAPQ